MPIYSVRRFLESATLALRAVACGAVVLPSTAAAQARPTLVGARGGLAVDGELENYFRYVTARDTGAFTPWSLRRFSPSEVETIATRADSARVSPWRDSWMLQREASRKFALLPASFSVRYNSTFPYGYDDGPIWAGKGATAALAAGFAVQAGPLSIVIDPLVFAAQNLPFRLQPNGQTGALRYGDQDYPESVDRPQRFGNRAYTRVDPGESTVQLSGFGMTAGATTANQWWGPASSFPLILGNNAAGIPSVFAGTSSPRPIGIGRLHARVTYGIESQSAFSPVVGADTFVSSTEPGRKRAMAGLVAVYQPQWIPHLEVGGARYFDLAWRGRPTQALITAPFHQLSTTASSTGEATGTDPDAVNNQLASVFFRWILPRSGLDIYSEYAREDHSYDLRDLAEEPDHSRSIMAGLRKSFVRPDGALSALRIEYVDASMPTLERHRDEGGVYVHTVLRQGHTQIGQLLGAPLGVGAFSGAMIAWDRFDAGGRTSWFVQRASTNNSQDFLLTGRPDYAASQLSGTVGVEGYRLHRSVDLMYAASLTDAKRGPALPTSLNLNLTIGLVPHPR